MSNQSNSKLSVADLRELHSLPDGALLNVREAAGFLRLSANALNWYRSQGCGPVFQRIGSTAIRYRVADLRAYMVEVQPLSRSYESRKARAERTGKEG